MPHLVPHGGWQQQAAGLGGGNRGGLGGGNRGGTVRRPGETNDEDDDETIVAVAATVATGASFSAIALLVWSGASAPCKTPDDDLVFEEGRALRPLLFWRR